MLVSWLASALILRSSQPDRLTALHRDDRPSRSPLARPARRVLAVAAALTIAALAAAGGGAASSKPTRARDASWPIPGYMMIADRGNDRLLLVDNAKHVLWRYPAPGAGMSLPFVFDDDVFFGPDYKSIVSNQEDQDTIQIISFPGGNVLWYYGHPNVKGSSPGYLNTPDDAYLLPNGLVTVADAYNCRILFINHAHVIVKQYGTTGVCVHNPPRELGAVNGATPLADGGTLVSEITGSWIDDIGPTGRLRWSVQAPVSYPSDPQLIKPGRFVLADYTNPGHVLIMTNKGKVLWRYGPDSGPGRLNHPSLATRIAPGLLAITDDYNHRVIILSIRTRKIVWQYGHTGVAGTADGYLNTPDGLDVLPTAVAHRLPAVRAIVTGKTKSG